jgi:pyruvate kinase
MRKTKIIATIGPTSRNLQIIKALIEAGVDVFRLNFSHGDMNYHKENIERIRKAASELKRTVAILQDLSGPKIRIGEVKNPFPLYQGEILEIYGEPIFCEKKDKVGKVYIDHPEILKAVKEDDLIFIADGIIKVRVTEKRPEKIITEVIQGGVISSKKGLNLPGGEIPIEALTEKDKKDLEFGLKEGVDFVALSFVRTERDILNAKEIIKKFDREVPILAKIETQKALENIDKIIETSDGLIVARGDLGVEISVEKIPIVQKILTKKAREHGIPVVIATQMLTSMINSTMPTRAEVSDIANAVFDGVDALMLSDETAVGNYPVEAVQTMVKIIEEAEKFYENKLEKIKPVSPDFAIAHSSCILAEELGAKAIIVFTKSGSSAKRVALFRPKPLIIANVHDEKTLKTLKIIWGIYPYMVLSEKEEPEDMIKEFIKKAYQEELIKEDDILVLTMGYPVGKPGSTNLIRVIKKDQILKYANE